MKIARVVGTVVSTVHHPSIDGRRLLWCDFLDLEGQPTGQRTIAMDVADTGAGEVVLLLDEGNGARQVLGDPAAPIRTVVVGVIDEVHVPGASAWLPPAEPSQ